MSNKPIIAINLTYLIPGEVGGSETVIRNILPAWTSLRRDWMFLLITTRDNHETFADDINVMRHRVEIDPRRTIQRILWEQSALPRLLKYLGTDVLFSPAYYGPVRWTGRHVVFVHDTNFERHPEDFGTLQRLVKRKLVWATCRRADRILTNSEFSRHEIITFQPDMEPKICVAPFGSDHMSAGGEAHDADFSKKFLLCVARWYPHKNLPFLVKTFAGSGQTKDHQLTLVGSGEGERLRTAKWVSQNNLQDSIIFKKGLSSSELTTLFQKCRMLISPSKYEGFGLPLLEAMRLRVPILCSDLSIHREVTGGHAHFFKSDDAGALTSALRELTHDDKKRVAHVEAAYQHAIQQTWLKTAQVFSDVFEDVLRIR